MQNEVPIKITTDTAQCLSQIQSLTSGIKGEILIWTAGFATAGAAIRTAVSMIETAVKPILETAKAGEEFVQMSQQIGVSVENLSKLKFAAEISETSFEALTTGMGIFSRSLHGMSEDGKSTTLTLKALGISTKDPYQAMMQLADAFSGMNDGANKTAIAMELMGRGGRQMIPLLNQGSAAIKELMLETKGFTDAQAKAADEFNDNILRLEKNFKSFGRTLGNAVIPVMNEYLELLMKTDKKQMDILLGELLERKQLIEKTIKEAKAGADQGGNYMGLNIQGTEKVAGALPSLEEELKLVQSQIDGITNSLNSLSTGKKTDGPKIQTEAEIAAAKKALEALQQYRNEVEQLNPDLDESGKKILEFWQKAMKGIREGGNKEAWTAAFKQAVESADQNVVNEQARKEQEAWNTAQKKAYEEYAKISVEMTDTIKKLTLDEFDYKREKLKEEYQKKADAAGGWVNVYKSYSLELQDIDNAAAQKRTDSYIKSMSDMAASFEYMSAESQKEYLSYLFDQMYVLREMGPAGAAAYEQIFEALKKFGSTATVESKKWSIDWAASLSSALDSGFFDAMTGKFKSFGDYLNQLWEGIARQISTQLAKGITDGLTGKTSGGSDIWSSLKSILGFSSSTTTTSTTDEYAIMASAVQTKHTGGMVFHTGGLVPRFHWGGLAADEVPAILQRGEYVVSRKGVAALDAINSGNMQQGSGGGNTMVVNNISALDGASVAKLFRNNAGALLGVVNWSSKTGGAARAVTRR
jgi:hypothetical protein